MTVEFVFKSLNLVFAQVISWTFLSNKSASVVLNWPSVFLLFYVSNNWKDKKKRTLWICVLHMLYVCSISSSRLRKTVVCESILTTTSPCFSFKLPFLSFQESRITARDTSLQHCYWFHWQTVSLIISKFDVGCIFRLSRRTGGYFFSVLWKAPISMFFLQAVGEKWPTIMRICPVPLQGLSLSRYYVQEKKWLWIIHISWDLMFHCVLSFKILLWSLHFQRTLRCACFNNIFHLYYNLSSALINWVSDKLKVRHCLKCVLLMITVHW